MKNVKQRKRWMLAAGVMLFLAVVCLPGMKEFSRAAGETDKNQNVEEQTEPETIQVENTQKEKQQTTETYATGLYIEENAGGGMLGNIGSISAENGISFYSIDGQAEVTALYYDQLDATSKEVYAALYQAYQAGPDTSKIVLQQTNIWKNQSITITDNSIKLPDSLKQEIINWESDIVVPAFLALIYDHPELNWLSGVSYGYGYAISSVTYSPSELDADNTLVTDIEVPYIVAYVGESPVDAAKSDMDAIISEAKTAINDSLSGSTSRYQTVKEIHDYICKSTSYASDTEPNAYQTAYSAFRDTNGDGTVETVCAGYSKGFKMLCDAYAIPCVLVSGTSNKNEAHMWNFVQMENGNWYAVDAAWDDQTDKIYYDFFLCGADTVAENFTKLAFSTSHISSGVWDSDGIYSFSYPTLNTEIYHEDSDGDGICDFCSAYMDGMGAFLAGYSLNIADKTGICFYMSFTDNVLQDEDAYVQFTLPDGSMEKQIVAQAPRQTVDSKEYYTFTCYVAAKEMADDIRVQVFLGDGATCGSEYTYSVQDYAKYILERGEEYKKELPVVKAMLNYGAAAQTFFSYHTETPANDILSEADKMTVTADVSDLTAYQMDITGELPEGFSYYGSSLVLKSGTKIRHYFTMDASADLEQQTFVLNGETVSPVDCGTRCYIEVPAVNMKHIKNSNTLVINDTCTITYGVFSYAYAVLSNGSLGSNLENVMHTLINYANAAENY